MGAATALCLWALPFASAAAQDWYIPKRTRVVRSGSLELGLRAQYTVDNDGLFDSRRPSGIFSVRHAPLPRFEVYAEVPYVYVEQEAAVNMLDNELRTNSGIGDVFAQLSFEALGGEDWRLLVDADTVFPTGKDPYDNTVGTGGGLYRLAGGVTAMKVIDPAVLFVNGGYQHTFPGRFTVGRVSPGGDIRYRFGAKVSLSPKIKAGVHVSGDIVQSTRLDGAVLAGSAEDHVRLGLGLDWIGSRMSTSATAVFGMTTNSPDATIVLGVKFPFRLWGRK